MGVGWAGVGVGQWGEGGLCGDTCHRSAYNVTAVCVALLSTAFKFTFQPPV